MSDIFEATAAYLADDDVRDRYEVAYQLGVDGGWLAASVENARTYPDSVRWVKVEAVKRVGAEVSVTVDGVRYTQAASYPIVLRAVAPS